jgi:CDP-4-dehydro-6-deoxyglucose reductase
MQTISLTSGKTFTSTASESMLDAALKAGITLSYSCRTGRCGTCRAQLLSGATKALHDESGLTVAEQEAGWVLTCTRQAVSDVSLDVDDLASLDLHAARMFPCRIQSMERLASDVLKVELRFPPGSGFRYTPGQYVDIIGPGGIRRSYSLANASRDDRAIELHVRQVGLGAMSDYWFDRASVNDLLRMNGPLGTFVLRDTVDADLVFLATGTGIAPVKAMLESLCILAPDTRPRSVRVYWGGRHPGDLYWDPRRLPVDIEYHAVLSRADADWTGRRGYVQHALLADVSSFERVSIYACGSDSMIRDARIALLAAGLPAKRFYSDAFVCSAAV